MKELKTNLEMNVVGNPAIANMAYTIENLGATEVAPTSVTQNLQQQIEEGGQSIKDALAPIGVVKIASSGCCSLSQMETKTVDTTVEQTTTTTSTTTQDASKLPPLQA